MFKINIEISPQLYEINSDEFRIAMERLSNAILKLAPGYVGDPIKMEDPEINLNIPEPELPKFGTRHAEFQHTLPSEDEKNPFYGAPKQEFTTHEVGGVTTIETIPQKIEVSGVTVTVPAVDLDSEGLPWDARIHARTKTKTADGKWKMARGINQKVVTEVKKGLHDIMSIRPLPTIPSHLPPPPPVDLPQGETFTTLMVKLTKANDKGVITNAQILAVVHEFGLPTITSMQQRPDLIPAIAAKLDLIMGVA